MTYTTSWHAVGFCIGVKVSARTGGIRGRAVAFFMHMKALLGIGLQTGKICIDQHIVSSRYKIRLI